MSAHTPGPWVVTECLDYWVGPIKSDGEQDGIALCGDVSWGTDRQDEYRANAVLISAAPSLLDALELVLPYAIAAIGSPREFWPSDSVILKAEAAVKQARGES